jgi:hypothetical protein
MVGTLGILAHLGFSGNPGFERLVPSDELLD